MNLKPFYRVILMAIIMLPVIHADGQSGSQINYFVPQPFPRSPNATAFEKYGTYQVNEFTGIPDISIPLYTITAGGFQVPITLSYHASGVKVTDVASWAGLGWSVSAGGQVSRRAMGPPDDGPYGYLSGYMWAQSAINTSTFAGVYYLENVANGTYDSKPDIYSYDFPGHGGKFFFDGSAANGTYPVRMLPYAPLKVSYNLVPYSYTNRPPNTGITRFDITDEHGNIYRFGDNGTEVTQSSSSGRPGLTISSTWKLETMISQNRRDTISFTFQSDVVNYPSADGEIYTVTDQIGGDTLVYSNASYSTSPTTPGNANVTTEELPQQINFKNGKVVFDLDASARTDINVGTPGFHAYGLNDIKVYAYNFGTKTMELQKTIVFYKTNFNGTTNPRLRLDSIQILDKAGAVMQHYRFDYNTSLTLPEYTSYKQDYWGYYNGKSNSMFTPQQTVTFQPYTISPQTNVTIGSSIINGRNCDSNYMQAYVLTGIHYPTGGYSTFTYQTNQYTDGSTVYLAGGLRIRSISSYDGISQIPIVRTYAYNTNRKNYLLDSGYFSTSQIHRYYSLYGGGGIPLSICSEVVRTYSSNPHCDLEPYDAATVVYPSVTEYIGTPGNNVGRTDYTFTDQADATLDASMAGNLIYLSSFYVRGHLASKIDYISNAGTYQKVKAVYNTYTGFPYTNYNNVGLAVKKLFYNEGPGGANPPDPTSAVPNDSESFVYPPYYITSDDNYLTSTWTYDYDTQDATKYTLSMNNYYYDNITHQQVTRAYHTDSRGNTTVATTKYPSDYPAGNPIIDSMVNRNMLAEAIEKYDTLKKVATGTNAIISGQVNKYKTGSITNTIIPSTISTLSVAQPLTDFSISTVNSNVLTSDTRYVQMISFDSYDGNNNLKQYTTRNANPVSILWDYLGELPVTQVKNSTISNIAYTSFEADSYGGWAYSGTPVYDPTAPAGFYSYPLTSGSVSANATTDNVHSYVLSYWSNGGPATVTFNSTSVSGTALRTAGSWTYYEHILPVASSIPVISGSGISIDELRLYPVGAEMTTYNYDPSGLRSILDTRGLNSYFEYDYLQRLKNAKDWAGNIVKNYSYHTYDQVVGNQAQSAFYTRKTCPPGSAPGSLQYAVPANRYYGSTQASANADAIYDMNLNGQVKANANCACPVQTFTLSNSTGLDSFQATFSGIPNP